MTDYKHIFEKVQAIQKGHFILTSGNHSDTYIQCTRILERPDITSKLCRELIKPWQNKNTRLTGRQVGQVDIVIGPALGGIILSYELSRLFKSKAMYLERIEGNLTLRRGFTIDAASQVIVAEDVITTGGSVKEVIDVIEKYKAKVIGIISLVDRRPAPLERTIIGDKDDGSHPERSEGSQRDSSLPLQNDCGQLSNGLRSSENLQLPEKTRKLFGVEFNSIIKVTPPIYQPDKCPLCKKGIPTEKPGSRGLKL